MKSSATDHPCWVAPPSDESNVFFDGFYVQVSLLFVIIQIYPADEGKRRKEEEAE